MTVESVTYISDLNASYPAAGDARSEGDDHIRNLKTGIKGTFPNVSGAVTPTHTELNYVDGVTSAIQTQMDLKAPLASPTFTGVPAAPTAAVSTSTTQIATTAFVAAAQGMVPIRTVAASGAATIDFDETDVTATYKAYVVVISGLVPATNGADLHARARVAAAWLTTGNYGYHHANQTGASAAYGGAVAEGATAWVLGTGLNNVGSGGYQVAILFSANAGGYGSVKWDGVGQFPTNSVHYFHGGGAVSGTLSGIRVYMSSGNITASATLYGLKSL